MGAFAQHPRVEESGQLIRVGTNGEAQPLAALQAVIREDKAASLAFRRALPHILLAHDTLPGTLLYHLGLLIILSNRLILGAFETDAPILDRLYGMGGPHSSCAQKLMSLAGKQLDPDPSQALDQRIV